VEGPTTAGLPEMPAETEAQWQKEWDSQAGQRAKKTLPATCYPGALPEDVSQGGSDGVHPRSTRMRGVLRCTNQEGCGGVAEFSSTFDHVQRQTGQRCLLVACLHVKASLIHGLDDLIERNLVAF
jgi:hypothetical protein